MSEPEPSRDAALQRLDERLDALEASQSRKRRSFEMEGSGAGYSLVAELLGGVLGGLGFGWLFDRFFGTAPLGLIGGLLIGTGASVFLVVRSASRMSGEARAAHPATSVADDDENDADR